MQGSPSWEQTLAAGVVWSRVEPNGVVGEQGSEATSVWREIPRARSRAQGHPQSPAAGTSCGGCGGGQATGQGEVAAVPRGRTYHSLIAFGSGG